ncbi:MAG: TIR domain-containing protein [Bacteroidaceae bacterium]|nr:TIR domain-containing protein [Bacteroidaceae bacterium]
MGTKNKYFAFISYKREDEEWAIWFQHEMEYYHLPSTLNGREDLPKGFKPVFRDVDELKAGNLPQQIHEALENSANLIVICSPNSAKSVWVNKEISDFIEIGKNKGINNVNQIFPFIVEGTPYAQNEEKECFPSQLHQLQGIEERIGGNVQESGRDKAFIKVIAGLLPNVSFNELWNRYEHDKAEEERKKREEIERFQRMQSRFVAEKACGINEDSVLAQLLSLEVLPKELSDPDRPYVVEAERALRQASFKHKVMLRGHKLSIEDVAFSSDGKLVASVANDFTIWIWDVRTGRVVNQIACRHPFGRCITFSPDDGNVVVFFADETIASWDVVSGKQTWIYEANELFHDAHIQSVSSIEYTPNGRQLVISTLEGEMCVLDFENGTSSTIQLDDPIYRITDSPDGRFRLTATDKGFILWDLENDAHVKNNVDKNAEEYVDKTQAIFSADSRYMAFFVSTPIKSNIIILELPSLKQVQTIEWESNVNEETGETSGGIVSIAFHDNGSRLITVHDNGLIYIWDIAKKKCINGDVISDVIIKNAHFDTFGNYIAMEALDNTIVVAETLPSCIKMIAIDESPLVSAALNSDRTQLVTSIGSRYEKAEMAIWDISSGSCEKRIKAHEDIITSIAYSVDGRQMASASADGTVSIWDAKSYKHLYQLKSESVVEGKYAFTCAVYSPDNTKLAASLSNGSVVIWDAVKWGVIRDIKSSTNHVFSIAFSPDGKYLAVGLLDREVQVWDVQTGEMAQSLEGHTNVITTVVFCNDNSLLISGGEDKQIICWDVKDGQIKWKKEVRDIVNSITCSCDGNYLVATIADINTPLIIIDTHNGDTIVTFDGVLSEPKSAFFSQDGRYVISTEKGGAIYWWDFPLLGELISNTREQLKSRQLTSEERKRFYID